MPKTGLSNCSKSPKIVIVTLAPDGGQARQREAVEVAAAARHPRTPEAQAVRVARRPVQLSGVALSSETHGKLSLSKLPR
jgi:hypothetical protein